LKKLRTNRIPSDGMYVARYSATAGSAGNNQTEKAFLLLAPNLEGRRRRKKKRSPIWSRVLLAKQRNYFLLESFIPGIVVGNSHVVV